MHTYQLQSPVISYWKKKKRSEKIFLCYYTSVHICVHIDSY